MAIGFGSTWMDDYDHDFSTAMSSSTKEAIRDEYYNTPSVPMKEYYVTVKCKCGGSFSESVSGEIKTSYPAKQKFRCNQCGQTIILSERYWPHFELREDKPEEVKRIETQEDFLKKILYLKYHNPDLEIHFCVDSDEILESGWTNHKITMVEVSPWYQKDEHIFTDEDEIREYFEDRLFEAEGFIDSIEVEEQYEREVKKAICVYTHANKD